MNKGEPSCPHPKHTHLIRKEPSGAVPGIDDDLEPRQREVVVVLTGHPFLDEVAQECGILRQEGDLWIRNNTALCHLDHKEGTL